MGNLSKDAGRNKGNKSSFSIYAIKIFISSHKIYAFIDFSKKNKTVKEILISIHVKTISKLLTDPIWYNHLSLKKRR